MATSDTRTVVSTDWLYCVLRCLNRDQMPFETQVQTLWPAPQDSLQQTWNANKFFFFFSQTCLDIFGKEMCPTLPSHPPCQHRNAMWNPRNPPFILDSAAQEVSVKKNVCVLVCFGGRLCSRKPWDVLFRKYFCTGKKKKVRLSQKDVSVRWRLDQR